jgi:peptide-methionine (S)-S-oxide reductase
MAASYLEKVEMRRLVTALVAIMAAIPAQASSAAQREKAVLAGGCFWGMESVFEHVEGVDDVVSGFAGGSGRAFGSYGGERTGFAEAVRITYDPARISYEQLLQIFFYVAHDPSQVNRQGPDVGIRYRSAIFPQNAQQRSEAEAAIVRLRASNRYSHIATRLETGGFEVAESDQQDFVKKHPTTPYVVINDVPKLAALKRQYPQLWRE